MSLGVAVAQPALPALVQRWLPRQTGRATAVYANGELIGELAPVALTAPLLLGLLGGSWALALLVWSTLPSLAALALWRAAPRDASARGAAPLRWWPDWRVGQTWRLGLILGCASVTYQAGNTFRLSQGDGAGRAHHPRADRLEPPATAGLAAHCGGA